MNRLPDGSASLSVPEDADDGSVLRVEGMPDPGGDRVYQVWVERDGEVVPVVDLRRGHERGRRRRPCRSRSTTATR